MWISEVSLYKQLNKFTVLAELKDIVPISFTGVDITNLVNKDR